MNKPRYVALSKPSGWASEHWSWQDRPTCVVLEDCPAPKPIGLLDARGTPLYRLSNRIPIGFHNRQARDE